MASRRLCPALALLRLYLSRSMTTSGRNATASATSCLAAGLRGPDVTKNRTSPPLVTRPITRRLGQPAITGRC